MYVILSRLPSSGRAQIRTLKLVPNSECAHIEDAKTHIRKLEQSSKAYYFIAETLEEEGKQMTILKAI